MFERLTQQWMEWIWGPGLLLLVFGVGIWLTVGSGFYPLRRAGRIFTDLFHKEKKGSGFAAAMTSLGATVGTGNIVGVASALAMGGAGAVFWMWIGAFFGMMLKYAEASLAIRYRGAKLGGAPLYIQKAFGSKGVAALWAVCCVAASFGSGNAVQVSAAAAAVKTVLHGSSLWVGFLIAALTGLVLSGRAKTVTKVSAVLVPVMAAFYLLGVVFVLWRFRDMVPTAFVRIFRDAFDQKAAVGGIGGWLTSETLRVGVARGTFTHEAGMGSASLAHAESEETEPGVQGDWGILEVFLDTMVVCTATALVLLVTGERGIQEAFSLGFGKIGTAFLATALFLFALAAVFGWEFYGEKALSFLTERKSVKLLYRGVFLAVSMSSAVFQSAVLWNLSDCFNGLMIFPNLAAVFLLRKEVFGFLKKKNALR